MYIIYDTNKKHDVFYADRKKCNNWWTPNLSEARKFSSVYAAASMIDRIKYGELEITDEEGGKFVEMDQFTTTNKFTNKAKHTVSDLLGEELSECCISDLVIIIEKLCDLINDHFDKR